MLSLKNNEAKGMDSLQLFLNKKSVFEVTEKQMLQVLSHVKVFKN
jgi:hypothetical protein